MKKTATFFALTAMLTLGVACGDDEGSTPDSGIVPDAPVQPDAGDAFPALGAQVDRAGRPAVTTALIAPVVPPASAAGRNTAKDAYNADGNSAGWVAANAAEIALNLGILDSLNTVTVVGDGCADQFGYDGAGVGTFYEFLSEALADDRLLIDSTVIGACNYLAVEAAVAANCGGRGLLEDTVSLSYGVLAAGALDTTTVPQFGATVVMEDGQHSETVFPFVGAPL